MKHPVTGALAALTMAWVALQAPWCANAHEAHEHASPPARPELAIGRSADYDYDPPEPGSYRLPPLKTAADGVVLDETGAERSLRELLHGRITVLSFIYTRCADVCPLATMLLHELHGFAAEDPDLRDNLRLLTISFDPEHDTPEVMAMHAAALRNGDGGEPGAEWRFLTTAGTEALKPFLAAYDQPVGRKLDPSDPLGPLAHQLRVYLIDRDARVRNIYSLGFLDTRLVMTDVRTLLLEEEHVAQLR